MVRFFHARVVVLLRLGTNLFPSSWQPCFETSVLCFLLHPLLFLHVAAARSFMCAIAPSPLPPSLLSLYSYTFLFLPSSIDDEETNKTKNTYVHERSNPIAMQAQRPCQPNEPSARYTLSHTPSLFPSLLLSLASLFSRPFTSSGESRLQPPGVVRHLGSNWNTRLHQTRKPTTGQKSDETRTFCPHFPNAKVSPPPPSLIRPPPLPKTQPPHPYLFFPPPLCSFFPVPTPTHTFIPTLTCVLFAVAVPPSSSSSSSFF